MENENQPVRVMLESEFAEAFPTSEAVNDALKELIRRKRLTRLSTKEIQEQINKVYGGGLDDAAMRQNIAKFWDKW